MRTIGVVTGARSDYGIYRPVLRAIMAHPSLACMLFVTGAHLSEEFGGTVEDIEQDRCRIVERIDILGTSDCPSGISESIGRGVSGFGRAYERNRPDILMVLGDRYEMLAAVVAALPHCLPVAHIHGGERTEGLIDEAIRHAITKMSHLHFASTEIYRRRIIQMGEEPWRVTVSGAPSLDYVCRTPMYALEEIESLIGLPLPSAPMLVTYHPVTLEHERSVRHVVELLAALEEFPRPIIFTFPNADTRYRKIVQKIRAFVRRRKDAVLMENMGTRLYFSVMRQACVMVGNSSSGIIEAPSFHLPVVNIGNRQQGRIQADNVVNAEDRKDAIVAALKLTLSDAFRRRITGKKNPYGDGNAAKRIAHVLAEVVLDERVIKKRFYDFPGAGI